MAKPLHITTAKPCISSRRSLVSHQAAEIAYHPSENEYISLSGEYIIIAKANTAYGWWYTPAAMIYTLKRDDMPLLSQWIKKYCRKGILFCSIFWWIRGESVSPAGSRSSRNCVQFLRLWLPPAVIHYRPVRFPPSIKSKTKNTPRGCVFVFVCKYLFWYNLRTPYQKCVHLIKICVQLNAPINWGLYNCSVKD